MKPNVFIGTSGWYYKHWHQAFYPAEIPKEELLLYYAEKFPTVEINASFYRLPALKTVEGWNRKAPKNFIYAVKGSRLITHYQRLLNSEESLKIFIERMTPLKEHLGPILWQLPPNFKKDLNRLETFISQLPKKWMHAVEFRHPSWVSSETFDLLSKYHIAQVWLSSQRMPMNCTITSNFIYMRFHGLEGGAAHDYTQSELEPWAQEIKKHARKKIPAYIYFNNDINSRAPENAYMLMRLIKPYSVPPTPDKEA